MAFEEQRRKAFDFCSDATKQLITLSTGIVAFMVTFAKDFVTTVPGNAKIFAYIGWGFHCLSFCSGMLVLLALTAQLEPLHVTDTEAASPPEPSIRGAAATYSFLQIITFVLAMIFTIVFGVMAAHGPVPRDNTLEQRVTELTTTVKKLQTELAQSMNRQEAFQQQLLKEHPVKRPQKRPANVVK